MVLHLRTALAFALVAICPIAFGQKYAKTLWEHDLETNGEDDRHKFVVDIAGPDTIWVGEVWYFFGDRDIYVERLRPDGTVVWSNTFRKPQTAFHLVQAAEAGSNGNVVIMAKAASSDLTAEVGSSYFLRLDPDGNVLATGDYDLGHNYISGMEIGGNGNIFLVYGRNYNTYSLVKLDQQFGHLWTRHLGAYGTSIENVDAPHIMESGDILVAGATGYQGEPVRLDRYTSQGNNVFTRTFGDGERPKAFGSSAGNTYLSFYDTSGQADVARLLRLDAAGNTVWNHTDPDVKEAFIAQLSTGDLVVAGRTEPSIFDRSYKIARVTEDGATVWADHRPPGNADFTKVRGLTVGPDDIIYTIGSSGGMVTETWHVISHAANGTLLYDWLLMDFLGQVNLPFAWVAESGGVLTIGGDYGSTNIYELPELYVRKLQAESKWLPIVASVARGALVQGGVLGLGHDDGLLYIVENRPTIRGAAPISVEVGGFVGLGYPANEVEFSVISSGDSRMLQAVELWNWRTLAWERRTLRWTDTVESTSTTNGLVSDNIHPVTGAVAARINVWGNRFRYQVSVDQAAWYVRP
ncbi:MAG TPA: hypothetical protein PLL78_12005 [Fimbriimonadaceae bacterium]|nr:hypothetical protein [Fimbriimonadaceae bacterium]HRJ97398.1 hypothetical protein [Fimbriimonadaceae bacterium]